VKKNQNYKKELCIGIDASNIRAGGGVTHLVELLRAADPILHGFSKIFVWSRQSTLSCIEDKHWLVKNHDKIMEKPLLYRALWQRLRLSKLARATGCDVLFVPGGSYTGNFRPMVTMSRNMLPFEWQELRRYGRSLMTLKLMLLRWTQSFTFHRAEGLIFLTQYACDEVMRVIKTNYGKTKIIPHGIDERFFTPPRQQMPLTQYSSDHPFRILYVSTIDLYKHQWHVAEAVAQLRKNGIPVVLELIGSANLQALERLTLALNVIDPSCEFVHYLGAVPYLELHTRYSQADLSVFASSCENMPNILLEGIASGLPIASSNRGPMPEILGDAGVYFDPENPKDIAHALRTLIESPVLRTMLAKKSFERAQAFSWRRCADDTFGFLAKVASEKRLRISNGQR
jgi:glycosyltransferase involved in cell wall biosynthesis